MVHQCVGEAAEQISLATSCREGATDAAACPVTRAAILRSLSLTVVDSAVAKSGGFGIAVPLARPHQYQRLPPTPPR
jgi:hypothetical protein